MKKMTRIFGVLLLVASAVILTSCKDDEPAIPESVVNWTLTLPETASDGTVSDVTALFTNINTSTTYKGTVTSVTKATVLTVSATVPEGLYKCGGYPVLYCDRWQSSDFRVQGLPGVNRHCR